MKNCTVRLEKLQFAFEQPPQQNELAVKKNPAQMKKGKYIQSYLLNK